MISLAIADHSIQFRKDLEHLLKNVNVEVVLSTANGTPFIEGLRKIYPPTVALINYQEILPFTLNTAITVKEHFPTVKIVVSTLPTATGLSQMLIRKGCHAWWKKDRFDFDSLLWIFRLVKQGYTCFPE